MVNLFLDPFVFACPQPEQGLEELDHYIESILLWKELSDTSWASIYISGMTYEVLDQTKSYPLWEFFNKSGKQSTQRKDILNLVNALLKKLPAIEERLKIREILWENMQCEPMDFLVERQPMFIEQFHRLVALMSLLCLFEVIKDSDQIVITRNLNGEKETVKIACDIVDCEFIGSSVQVQMPLLISSSFPLCENPHGLCLSANPINVWSDANYETSYHKALSIYLYQRIFTSGSSQMEMKHLTWAFGANFIKTAETLGFANQENKIKTLLRACAETILGENTRDVHGLREGKSGSASRKKFGSDEACRRDIDYEYHLHYWKTANGPILMSVVVHNDMSITPLTKEVQFGSIVDYLPHLAQEQED
jgi:hypothetical protein